MSSYIFQHIICTASHRGAANSPVLRAETEANGFKLSVASENEAEGAKTMDDITEQTEVYEKGCFDFPLFVRVMHLNRILLEIPVQTCGTLTLFTVVCTTPLYAHKTITN